MRGASAFTAILAAGVLAVAASNSQLPIPNSPRSSHATRSAIARFVRLGVGDWELIFSRVRRCQDRELSRAFVMRSASGYETMSAWDGPGPRDTLEERKPRALPDMHMPARTAARQDTHEQTRVSVVSEHGGGQSGRARAPPRGALAATAGTGADRRRRGTILRLAAAARARAHSERRRFIPAADGDLEGSPRPRFAIGVTPRISGPGSLTTSALPTRVARYQHDHVWLHAGRLTPGPRRST